MLHQLHIKNFAVIEACELDFQPGFSVVTGETGAGKSILIDALVIALGGRFSTDVIREGAETAEVQALFDITAQNIVQMRLAERELQGDDPSALIIKRVVRQSGRGKVVVNGHITTVATLREVVAHLADVSGQHEQLSLLQAEQHLDMLDRFGELVPQRERYAEVFDEAARCRREYEALLDDDEAHLQRIDFLRFQLEEIERVAPSLGEDEKLGEEHRRLVNADDLQRGAEAAEALLYGDDDAAFDRVSKAIQHLGELGAKDAILSTLAEDLESALQSIEECARALQRYQDGIDGDPARLEVVEERMGELDRLSRKYGGSLARVLEESDSMDDELHALEGRDEHSELRKTAWEKAEKKAQKLANALSLARKSAAGRFAKAIVAEVSDMELAGARFEVALSPQAALGPRGAERAEFQWSANPGLKPRSLAKIASGGELSRLMLAVKQVLRNQDLVSLYVFDEVDTGLGGKAADAIGRKIQNVAQGHQALVITHLAPIAARADHHLLVEKHALPGGTQSEVLMLKGPAREAEIARMMGGATVSAATKKAARAMLKDLAS